MKISRSPDLEWKSPDFFLPKTVLARSIASFAIVTGESIVSLVIFFKPFVNCVVMETKYSVCVCRPQEDAIFVGTQWSHMLERLNFAIAWPSLGLIRSLATKASEEEGFPEIRHCCTFYRLFRTMSDNVAKQWRTFKGNYRVGADTSV